MFKRFFFIKMFKYMIFICLFENFNGKTKMFSFLNEKNRMNREKKTKMKNYRTKNYNVL